LPNDFMSGTNSRLKLHELYIIRPELQRSQAMKESKVSQVVTYERNRNCCVWWEPIKKPPGDAVIV
jgi:hypothetical protein